MDSIAKHNIAKFVSLSAAFTSAQLENRKKLAVFFS